MKNWYVINPTTEKYLTIKRNVEQGVLQEYTADTKDLEKAEHFETQAEAEKWTTPFTKAVNINNESKSDVNKLFIVQGDLAFWHYSVYGIFTTRELALARIDKLIDDLSDNEYDELQSEFSDEEPESGLFIHEVVVNDNNTDTIEW